MRNVSVSRVMPVPKEEVWRVLADFPGIDQWNSGIKKSYATSSETTGVGAKRHCDLAPLGELEETIGEWVPNERLVVNIDSATKVPIESGAATFILDETDGSTTTTISYSYKTKFGPIGRMMGPMLDKKLTSGFDGFLVDLEKATQATGVT